MPNPHGAEGQQGHEIDITNVAMDGLEHVGKTDFDLLKVLGQGSFGRVIIRFDPASLAHQYVALGISCAKERRKRRQESLRHEGSQKGFPEGYCAFLDFPFF